jgi:hypothetical protein
MEKLLEWVDGNVKEGVDTAEFKEMLSGSVLPEFDGTEDALGFIRKHPKFNSALDQAINSAVKTHDEKVNNEKLPKMLDEERKKIREELMKELNPEETPEQKQIRELREQVESMAREKSEVALKDKLRSYAKEIGYPDVTAAEKFSVYGENALDALKQEHEFIQQQIKAGIESEIKNRFGDTPPPSKGAGSAPASKVDELVTQYNEIEASNDPEKGMKLIALKDQIAKAKRQAQN